MKSVIFSLLLAAFFSHDIQVAFFKLSQEDNQLTMEIKFEKEDLESTFDENHIELNDKNIKTYLLKNLTLAINGNKQQLSFDEMLIKNKHIYLKSNILEIDEVVKSVDIQNTCLLNIANHSNIVEVRLNKSERDFLMDSDRTSIKLSY